MLYTIGSVLDGNEQEEAISGYPTSESSEFKGTQKHSRYYSFKGSLGSKALPYEDGMFI